MQKTGVRVGCVILAAYVAVMSGGMTAHAEVEPIAEMQPMVVTAARQAMPLRETADIVKVIDRTEIEWIKPQSLGDLLEYANGVSVETGTGSGQPDRSVVSINGLPPSYTLVLVNGVKLLSEHIHTGQNIDNIPPSAVERIEVMRGAASAQYGSDAIGGIVNIITRKYEGTPESGLHLSGGSYSSFGSGAHVLMPVGKNAGIASFVNWEQSDGVDITSPAHRVDNMGYKRFNWFNRVDAMLGEDTALYGWVNWVENEMDWRGDTADSTLVAPVAGLQHALSPSLNLAIEAAYSEWDAEVGGENNRLFEPEAYLRWAATEKHTVLFGGEYRKNDFERTAVVAPDQEAYAVYAQDEFVLDEWLSVMAALRYDKVEKQDEAISPKLSLLADLCPAARLRASVGRGYHAPTLQELYEEGYGHGGAAYRFGNPDLDPETSTTYTLGLETEPVDTLQLMVYGFYSDLTDMIVPVYEGAWDQDPTIDVWRRRNIEQAEVYGAEAAAVWFLSDQLTFEGGYTWTENEDRDTGRQLPYSPGSSAFGKLHFVQPFSGGCEMQLFVGVRSVFDRQAWNWKPASDAAADNPDGLVTALEDYTKLDAGISLVAGKKWDVYAKVENMLGEDIENLDDAHTIIDGEPVYTAGLNYRFSWRP